MKLDATDLRYVTPDEFRVLTAVEMGSKNHEVVPTVLIAQISGLRNGGVNKLIGSLAKRNLVSKVQNSKYDGYRLTYGGYDYLAMRALSKRDSMYSVGNQIGVGKESGQFTMGSEMLLRPFFPLMHFRLGRISFRAIKEKRDYLGKRKSASWMYMSRLAAQKEWAFMKVLHEHGFPVPRPIDQARHCILMELIDAYPMRQIAEVPSPGKLYSTLMDLIVRFAHAGLIHGDFNEFNILIRRETGEPVVIDFPQMVSTSHENAEWQNAFAHFSGDDFPLKRFSPRRRRKRQNRFGRFENTRRAGRSQGSKAKQDTRIKLDSAVATSSAKAESSKKANPSTPAAQKWAAGQECLAKYAGDGSYYPARITSVIGSTDNPLYIIMFKGYNTTEQAKPSELKPLPPHYNFIAPTSTKRKLTPAEEEERERKKKKNEKKLEVKAAKAKEQTEKQATWQKFTKKAEKKNVHIAGIAGTSIFKTPDNPLGRVGVTGSGKGMTEVAMQAKHKFAAQADDGY
ncbi:Tudor domain-containing protein [Mycena indigotica]|uniref:Serine/threonine-protein kinase RIO2 n=1 Tax=Mycena indigotica TaxID=2126181 RepID=A0A8H6T009_9AGAR|nr:Tudor domain-containing protein [Mycena indigotica]KAF7306985.1 Tudor domain-containing protein [Mycena indigotica]